VLTDLVRRPVLRDSDLELERNVVLEEINTVDDTPDDLVFELSSQALWPSIPTAIPSSARAIRSRRCRRRPQRAARPAYFPGNCVIAAAGNLSHTQLLDLLEKEGWFEGEVVAAGPPAPAHKPAARGVEQRHEKDTAQTHIVFATEAMPFADPRKFALMVLANVFGGGMSSRLFQRIREELGLAYAVYAYTSFYPRHRLARHLRRHATQDRGPGGRCDPGEYARLAREGLDGEALAEAKRQTMGQLVLGLESPTARMYRLAGAPLYGESYRSLGRPARHGRAPHAGRWVGQVAGRILRSRTPDRGLARAPLIANRDGAAMIVAYERDQDGGEPRALVPAGAEALRRTGTPSWWSGARASARASPTTHTRASAPRSSRRWRTSGQGRVILKVKEPIEPEWPGIRKGQVLFTYFHFAAAEALTKAIVASGAVAIAYETVQLDSGELPLLTPMSEVAGRMAVQEGTHYLEKFGGGSGILLAACRACCRARS